MNNRFLISLILGALPLTMMAQDDDMYFVPTKKTVEKAATNYAKQRSAYYSGSNRSVDEYNRRGGFGGSYYQVVSDTTGSDVIDFSGELGVYPDSAQAEDFALTRQMSRYDGYEPDVAYREGYLDGRRDSWGWHSPWYYSSFYPWYDTYWYDPWYYGHYGWYGSWYDPWYYDYYWHRPYGWYGYYGYYHPYYHGGGYIGSVRTGGTQNHGRINYGSPRGLSTGRSMAYSSGRFGGRSVGATGSRSGSSRSNDGISRSSSATRTSSSTRTTNSFGNFGGSYSSSSSSSSAGTRSYSSGSSSGSFGGSRSSGSSGGSRSSGGGGGHFGGHR